jgi:hypothetical protein
VKVDFLCAKFDVFAGTNWRAVIVSISEDQTDNSRLVRMGSEHSSFR